MNGSYVTRLDRVMGILSLSAKELSLHCNVSNSLISRWQKGRRILTERTPSLASLAASLTALDTEGLLDEILAEWHTEDKEGALRHYLTENSVPEFPKVMKKSSIPYSGEYTIEIKILLGAAGLRSAMLQMLDYLTRLPSGQRVIVYSSDGHSLWHDDLSFAVQFLESLQSAARRGATFTLIRRGDSPILGSRFLSLQRIVSQLRGVFRSKCCEVNVPDELFLGVIPGYLSGRTCRDDTAEDGLITTLHTAPRIVVNDVARCDSLLERGTLDGQYGFLNNPRGEGENVQLWEAGPLPRWRVKKALPPVGNFSAIYRVPSFGVITSAEAEKLFAGKAPPMPDFLFADTGIFAGGRHRIILCREDMREGLTSPTRVNEPLSVLAGRSISIPQDMLRAQIVRLLEQMRLSKDFEVALMPRSAFEKLELELIYWERSACIGWLQDGSESVFDCNPVAARDFESAVDYAWERLRPAWKRYRNVTLSLRTWLSGQNLDTDFDDSAVVKNWELLPKE